MFAIEAQLIKMAIKSLRKREDSGISEANLDKIEENLKSTEEMHGKTPVRDSLLQFM